VARIAWHLATETAIPVLFFTGETTTSQMAKRMLAVATGVPLSALMEGRVREEMSQLEAARAKAEGAPLILDGAPQVSMAVLAGKARRARTVEQVRVVIVDGFQRIRGNPAENSRDLKDLAMQLGITVIVTSQLYHGLELRDDKTPILADLAAERPELEQDGATIILLHRLMREGEEQSTEAEARVVKHRLGPTGNAPLTFQRFPVRFVDRG
jgi:replicative DNA helicase